MKTADTPLRVLMDGSGTPVIGSHISLMRAANYYVAVTDIVTPSVGFSLADAGYVVPPYSDETATEIAHEKILLDKKIDMVIPIVDEGLAFWAARANKWQSRFGLSVMVSPLDSILICDDKYVCHQYFCKHGIPSPDTSLKPSSELRLAKPRKGRGSSGIRLLSEGESVSAEDGYMYQRYIEGQEYTVDLLCSHGGKAVYCVVRKRLETESGVSVKGEVVSDEKIESYARRIADLLNLFGPINIQCIRDDTGVYFTDVNPRTSGGQTLSQHATENWYRRYPELIRGEMHEPLPVNKGLTMIRYYHEAYFQSERSDIS